MMYPSSGSGQSRLLTTDAFYKAAAISPTGAKYWSDKVEAVTAAEFEFILSEVADTIITQTARNFAKAMLIENQQRLLDGLAYAGAKS